MVFFTIFFLSICLMFLLAIVGYVMSVDSEREFLIRRNRNQIRALVDSLSDHVKCC